AFVLARRTRRRPPARRGRLRRRSRSVSDRRPACWFAGSFALALLVLAPLQLVLPRLSPPPGLSAAGVEGGLWRGTLRQAQWRGAALGDLRLGLSPLPLLTGRRRLWLRSPQAA